MTWSKLSEQMFPMLWDTTWQSALLAGIVFVITGLVGRCIVPASRVAFSAIPLLRLVVLSVPVTAFSLFHWVGDPAARLPQGSPVIEFRIDAPVATVGQCAAIAREPASLAKDSIEPVRPTAQQSWRLESSLAAQATIAIWIAGVVFFSLRWFGSSIALRRMLRRGEVASDARFQALVARSCRDAKLVRRVTCVLTDEEIGPSTCGLLRPKIVISKQLANELAADELQIVIAHEIEHVRRCDCLLLLLGRLAVTMHWFNPLAYVLRRVLQREIELAVDASTLGKLGESRATMYGQLLIRIATRPNPPLGMVQMAGRRTNLRRRVERLMNWRRPSGWQFMLGAVIACLLALVGLSDGERQSVAAQESSDGDQAANVQTGSTDAGGEKVDETADEETGKADPQELTFQASGRVIDADGKPVPGARLMAGVFSQEGTLHTVSEKTNERGEYSIAYPQGHNHDMYHTWVYAEGHGIRVVRMGRVFRNERVETDVAEGVEIQLPPNETTQFRVLLPDGEPCAGAVVHPRFIDVPNGPFAADEPTGLKAFLLDELKPLISRQTDADGRVEIESIPKALFGSVEVETPQYGRQHFRPRAETLRLSNVGKINGVLRAESPERFAGTRILITSQNVLTELAHSAQGISPEEGIADVQLDEDGRFHVPAIAPGDLRLDIVWDSNSEIYPIAPKRATVRSGETLSLVIEARPTIVVTGSIVTADTRQPVAGARIYHRYPDAARIPNYAETDESGRYTTRLPAGKFFRQIISLGLSGIGSRYDYPSLSHIEIPADADKYEAEVITVSPQRLVKGVLHDETGKPVAHATVVLHTGRYRHVAGKAESNLDGTFEMRVRRWNATDVLRKARYWATLDRPAVNTEPPLFTKLIVIDDNPDGLVLRRP